MPGLWWLLIVADLLLVAAVAALFWRIRRGGGQSGAGLAPRELEAFLREAARLAREFDRLLGEKRELVAASLDGIDQRLAELSRLANALDQRLAAARVQAAQAAPAAPPTPAAPATPATESPAPPDPAALRTQVLALARQGKPAAEIAAIVGRPRGEVELVLGLLGQGQGG